ncbi:hypothetical protein CTAYLR_004473 [Chrysophaeum taylorii]|uniref:Uncharacterized protein n=1 Tax=Chrysophaeum taylorii TaxID=2483200 RepID=A0AAD7XLJ8_9STRA|nr:hypothetical protein CTAYLR_004421 [Chrysophaeum taylorii]KAJ8613632.1 hypothetical protein CTAYLR_004473 [Chrysophaeum taylorii]
MLLVWLLTESAAFDVTRRSAIGLVGSVAAPSTGITGLLVMPPRAPLRNEYVFVRAAESVADAEDVIDTNAATKMSVERNSLTARGVEQAHGCAVSLENPLIYYSTARSSEETAQILRDRFGTTNERFVPEFSLLDARGFGAHEGERLSRIPELHALYDSRSRYLKPPEGEDGAYAESVDDAFARIRQVLSKTETMHCGETIVLVAPGSDLFSIAKCAIDGKDLRTHFLDNPMEPGEARPLLLEPAPATKTTEPGPTWAERERSAIEAARSDLETLATDVEWALSRSRSVAPAAVVVEEVGGFFEVAFGVLAAGALAALNRSPEVKEDEVVPEVQTAPKPPPLPTMTTTTTTYDDDAWLNNIQAILEEEDYTY